jgi:hypothetical protein
MRWAGKERNVCTTGGGAGKGGEKKGREKLFKMIKCRGRGEREKCFNKY